MNLGRVEFWCQTHSLQPPEPPPHPHSHSLCHSPARCHCSCSAAHVGAASGWGDLWTDNHTFIWTDRCVVVVVALYFLLHTKRVLLMKHLNKCNFLRTPLIWCSVKWQWRSFTACAVTHRCNTSVTCCSIIIPHVFSCFWVFKNGSSCLTFIRAWGGRGWFSQWQQWLMDLAGTLLLTVKRAVCQQARPEGYNLIKKAIVYHAILCGKKSPE